MASVKSVNITNLDATPSVMVDAASNTGSLHVHYDTYEAASLASASDITIARLPIGATVHNVILKCDALGGSSTLKVGDASDDDRYMAAVGTWNVAGQSQSMLAGSSAGAAQTPVTGLGYKITSSTTDLVITTGGATITGSIHLWVHYAY
jgi:hypothetical protein